VGDKLGMDPWIGQPACCELCQKPFFSGVVDLFESIDDRTKVAICGPCEIRMVIDHTLTECGKRVACWSGFPCTVYIDSNHRDSRI
jgi:hypothetical protein